MAVVAPATMIITVPTNKVKTKKNKKKINLKTKTHKKERHQGGPYDNNKALFAYCDVFFSLLNPRHSSPIWGSTPHNVLHEKHVQKHQKCQTSFFKSRSMNERYLQLEQN
jgi:hypothetical protein